MSNQLKQILCICLISLFLTPTLKSQEVKWSSLQSSGSGYEPQIIGEDSEAFYSVSKKASGFYVERFDKKQLAATYSTSIKKTDLGNANLTYEGVYLMNNTFIVFASLYSSKNDEYSVFAYKFNAKTGAREGDAIDLLTMDAPSFKNKGAFNVFVSNDKSKVLVNYTAYIKADKNWKEKYLLFDQNLDIITEKEEVINLDELNFRAFTYFIDNEGSFYHLKKTSSGLNTVVSYNARMDYEKWESKIDFSEMERNMSIYTTRFILNSKNELMMVGLYTINGKALHGTFVMKVSKESKEVVSMKANPFSDDVKLYLAHSNSYLRNSENRIPISTYNRVRTYIKADGGFVLTGENLSSVNNSFLAGDIIILNHSEDGSLIWSKRIAKSQTGNSKAVDYMSCFVSITGNTISLYAYDTKANYEDTSDFSSRAHPGYTRLNNRKRLVFIEHRFDLQTGEYVKERLHSPYKDIAIKTSACYQRSFDSDIFYFSYNAGKYRLGLKRFAQPI